MKKEPFAGIAPWQMVISVIIFLMISAISHSQSRITNTNIQLKENKLHVTYDIENSKRSDRYQVRLEVTDSIGNSLQVSTVEGDLGDNVSGGNRKEIKWDLEADSILMNADIYIQLYAEAIKPPEPEVTEIPVVPLEKEVLGERDESGKRDVPVDTDVPVKTKEKVAREFNRTGIILQSVAIPGLGLSRVTGKPHWLKGVAGYGCIIGAVVLNDMALETYEHYKTPRTAEEADRYLKEARLQDNFSEVLAYSAIGIWVADMIWTIAGTSDLKKSVTMRTNYDPHFGVPLLTLRYKF